MTLENGLREQAQRVGWDTAPIWSIARRVDRVGHPDAELLSVYRDWGVVRKSDRDDNFNVESDDLSAYKYVKPGNLVLNKMKTWQGSLAVSDYEGIVSPAYFTCELVPSVHPRYIHYLLRSAPYIAVYAAASKGIRPNQWDLPYEEFRKIPALLPALDEQRRIADFLDNQVSMLSAIVTATRTEIELLDRWRVRRLSELMFSPFSNTVALRSLAEVRLGRQRSPERAVGRHMTPYLRSANVVDGQLRMDDVLEMDFSPEEQIVFALRKGDVLVTEGAGSADAVGASAVWDGSRDGVCFQNTLVRLRARPGRALPDFLGWWARIAHLSGAMRAAATGANILHLGAEGVAKMAVPVASLEDQERVVVQANAIHDEVEALRKALVQRASLLTEYKQSLVTAAVTGQFDVRTASTGVCA